MNANRRRPWLLPLALLLVVAGLAVAYRASRRPTSADPAAQARPQPDSVAPSEAADGFDLEGYVARVRQWKPGETFDHKAHEAALNQVGPAALAAAADLGKARQALADYEREHRRATPERAALADAVDALLTEASGIRERQRAFCEADPEWRRLHDEWTTNQTALAEFRRTTQQRLASFRAATSRPDVVDGAQPADPSEARAGTVPPELQAEIDRLRADAEKAEATRLALEARQAHLAANESAMLEMAAALSNAASQAEAKQEALRATFAEDEGWKDLNAKAADAEARRKAAHARVQALAQTRMRVESEMAKAKRGDGTAATEDAP